MSQINQQLIIDFDYGPEYTFGNFVNTPATDLAYKAALSIVADPGKIYNPLHVFGEEGVGKTHLLKSIGSQVKANSQNAYVVYINSKNALFKDEKGSNGEFDIINLVDQYKNVDLLIIDDIDVLQKKPPVEEKIFHMYNHLIQKGKQLIFSSRTPPDQLQFSDLNLKSRLKAGLSVKIDRMDDEDKRKVLKKLSKDFEIVIPDNVINFILNSAPRDFKSLQKIARQINELSLETKEKITLSLAKKALDLIIYK